MFYEGGALGYVLIALRHKSQICFMLACFYGTFSLGLLYWPLYLLVNNYMSTIFYVSELSWIAAYLFLLMLCQTLPSKEERHYRPALAWAIPVLTLGVVLYLVQTGELFANISMCALLGICGWFATRDILLARRQPGDSKERQVLYSSILLLVSGYLVCIGSAYINTFFVGIYHTDLAAATVEITPVVEEVMKLLPLLFYLLVFDPKPRDAFLAILIINAGFATFENTCYLIENGASQFAFFLMRGLGTGTMHVVCGVIIGYGLLFVWQRPWLKFAGTLGLLCADITYHAVCNMFVGEG